jgi:O-antigen ligase
MDLNTTSLASPVEGESSHCLTTSWQFIRSHDNGLLYLSLVLLVLSSVDNGPLGGIVKLFWLASVASLTFINIGAAFAAYISSLAIYSPLYFEGWSSPFQRPDNYALLILFAGMLFLALDKEHTRPRFDAYVFASLIFFTLHGLIFSRMQFAALLKTIFIPLLACELLAATKLREGELDALQNGMAVLGSYMGLVSILERTPAVDWIVPYWVGNPSLRALDPSLDDWIGSGRSGGTLLQPAFNGLLLSLIICILLLRFRRGRSWPAMIAISLCAVGSFFTYTRGVWLGLALALMWFPGWCHSIRQAYSRRAALVCVAAVLLVVAGGTARERLQDSGTVYYRLNLWGAGLRLAGTHPLFGIGFLQFGSAMKGIEQGFGSLLPSSPDVEGEVPSHNTLLTVLVEFGALGFLFYAAAFLRIVQRARNNTYRLWGRSGAAWVLAFTIVYLVNAQFVSAFEAPTNLVFLGFLGAIAGADEQRHEYSAASSLR